MSDRKMHDANPCYEELERVIDSLSKTSPVTAEKFKGLCNSRRQSPYRILCKLAEKLIKSQEERTCLA